MKIDKIEFMASLPPITSAILVSGNNEGARIKLDVPASELYAIVQLQLLFNQSFKVTIEPTGAITNNKPNKIKFLKDIDNGEGS